jgi:hypothetical protein
MSHPLLSASKRPSLHPIDAIAASIPSTEKIELQRTVWT